MDVSSSTASYVAQTQTPQQQNQVRAQQQAQPTVSDGADIERDGDADDKANVTATRGQNVNILA